MTSGKQSMGSCKVKPNGLSKYMSEQTVIYSSLENDEGDHT